MSGVLLSGLRANKRRLTGTFLAILLGVAFLAATTILAATMTSAIDGFFTRAYDGTDVVVRGTPALSDSPNAARPPIAADLLERVRAVPGVALAEPDIEGFGQILASDGKVVQVNGPRQAGTWLGDSKLNPYRLVEGHAPTTTGEVVLNRATAKAGALHLGDHTTLLLPSPRPVTIVGIATFGDADAFGGTSYVGLTAADAQRYLGTDLTSIRVKGADDVTPEALVRRIGRELPEGVQAVTGATVVKESNDAIGAGFLTALRALLGAFAGIALLVAVLSIHNTFAILVAQRTRETALLRAVGASRRQVLVGVMLEAAAVGLLASLAGVAGGYGLAAGLMRIFRALGFAPPIDGLVFPFSTVVVCVPTGVVITVFAAVAPALRAARVAPVEALRESATERIRPSRARLVFGALLGSAGLVGAGVGTALPVVGMGALLVVVGIIALAPVAAGVLRLPGRWVTSTLAGQNARRNPRRTAGAAAALVIGVGVVTLFTVAAGSLGTASTSETATTFTGDFAVAGGQFGLGGLSPRIVSDLAKLPQVSVATGVGRGQALLSGKGTSVSVADPSSLTQVVSFTGVTGVAVNRLAPGQLGVGADMATDRGWKLGERVPVRYPDGSIATVTVATIYKTNPLVDGVLFPAADWAPHAPQGVDNAVYLRLAPGVAPADARQAVSVALRPYGSPKLSDADELAGSNAATLDQLLNLVYVLLAIAVLTALMGIANTLSLAVHERTRELGLLRAVGASRRQIRALVRWESVLIAVFGTVIGAGLGVGLGWALLRAADVSDFSVRPVPLAVIVAGGAFAGLLAGALPARRAARLDILRAIATA